MNGQTVETQLAVLTGEVKRIVIDVSELRVGQREAQERVERAVEKTVAILREEASETTAGINRKLTWVQVTMVGLLTSIAGAALLLAFSVMTRG